MRNIKLHGTELNEVIKACRFQLMSMFAIGDNGFSKSTLENALKKLDEEFKK